MTGCAAARAIDWLPAAVQGVTDSTARVGPFSVSARTRQPGPGVGGQ